MLLSSLPSNRRAIPAAHGDCPSAPGISRGISSCLSCSFLKRGVSARFCGPAAAPRPWTLPGPRSGSVSRRGAGGRDASTRSAPGPPARLRGVGTARALSSTPARRRLGALCPLGRGGEAALGGSSVVTPHAEAAAAAVAAGGADAGRGEVMNIHVKRPRGRVWPGRSGPEGAPMAGGSSSIGTGGAGARGR